MISSVLLLRPRNGDAGALVRCYREERILERAAQQPGCLQAQLLVPLLKGAPAMATALWESAEAYQGWVENPFRAASTAKLNRLLDMELSGDVRGSLYEVALSVSNPAGPRPGPIQLTGAGHPTCLGGRRVQPRLADSIDRTPDANATSGGAARVTPPDDTSS